MNNIDIEDLVEKIACKVAAKLTAITHQTLISREDLAAMTGLSVRTIDRMAKGGSWELDKETGQKIWKPTVIKLTSVKRGSRVLFEKNSTLDLIKAKN